MKKKLTSLFLVSALCLTMSTTTLAAEPESEVVSLQEFHVEDQAEIIGVENGKLTRGYSVGTCLTGADIEKRMFKKEWRGSGEVSIIGGVTWDITINCDFYKDGHYNTGNDTTQTQTDNAYVATKFLEGESESQFGVHCQFTVVDDNGVTIHDSQLSAGNPFD